MVKVLSFVSLFIKFPVLPASWRARQGQRVRTLLPLLTINKHKMGTTQYSRVIPRDFFNEAKLLKCMGVLSLAILDRKLPKGMEVKIEETGEPFEICLSDEGSLFVSNYPTAVNGERVIFKTTYNSKSNYPFYCETQDIEVCVFDESGNFDSEFIEHFTTVKA